VQAFQTAISFSACGAARRHVRKISGKRKIVVATISNDGFSIFDHEACISDYRPSFRMDSS